MQHHVSFQSPLARPPSRLNPSVHVSFSLSVPREIIMLRGVHVITGAHISEEVLVISAISLLRTRRITSVLQCRIAHQLLAARFRLTYTYLCLPAASVQRLRLCTRPRYFVRI
jgi:hypothetical protein